MGVIESLSLQKHCKKVCNSKQIWNNESKNGQKRNILMTGEEEEDDGRKRKKKKKRWKQTRGEIHKVKISLQVIDQWSVISDQWSVYWCDLAVTSLWTWTRLLCDPSWLQIRATFSLSCTLLLTAALRSVECLHVSTRWRCRKFVICLH